MSLQRYAGYKVSDVAWLGDVPAHWTVTPLKGCFTIFGGSTPKSEEAAYWDGEIVWVSPADLSKLSSLYIDDSARKISRAGLQSCGTTLVPEGSIVLSTRAPIGSLAIAKTELCTNQGCKSLVPKSDIDELFYAYCLLASTEALNLRGKGTTFLELSADELGAFKVPLPPFDEQSAIAAFLDRETGKIDALIAEQEKLITLLAEKRQAAISHAVTRGLNPDAPMKDSGVAWLGQVPAHWEVCQLKRVFASVDYGISDSLDVDGAVAVLRMGNISDGKVKLGDLKYVNDVDVSLLLKPDDLLFNRTNSIDLIGKVGLFTGSGDAAVSFASYLVRIRLVTGHIPKFFAYLMNTPGLLGDARSRAFEAIGQCNLNPTRYGQITVAIAPPEEQKTIMAYLDRETSNLDALIAEAKRAVELLKERRSAMIAAAVTGKVDVRQPVELEAA